MAATSLVQEMASLRG